MVSWEVGGITLTQTYENWRAERLKHKLTMAEGEHKSSDEQA